MSASPASAWKILDVRDGGWNLWAGLVAAAIWTVITVPVMVVAGWPEPLRAKRAEPL